MTDRALSVVMPALNEEGDLPAAVASVRQAVRGRFRQHELILIDDGSTDGTGALADRYAREDPAIRVIHNGTRRGLGYSYRRGVEAARHEWVVMVPGDNEVPADSLAAMFDRVGTADVVAPYFTNPEIRPWGRRLLSRAFTGLVNAIAGGRLHYYNGPCVHRRALVLAALPRTDGFAYMAVLLARLMTSGYSVAEVGLRLGQREHGASKAFGLRNVLSVAGMLLALFVELRIQRRRVATGPAPTRSVRPSSPCPRS